LDYEISGIGLLAFLDYSDASRLSGSEFTTRAIVVVVCRAFLLIHPRDKLTQSSSLFAVRRIFVNYRGRDYVENVEAEKKLRQEAGELTLNSA
jgi:hypothetical protein